MTQVLKYPTELNPGQVDYLTFKSEEYRSNKGKPAPNAGAPSKGADIILYMPTTTPAVQQAADWGKASFEGPLGDIVRNISIEGTQQIQDLTLKDFETGKAEGKQFVEGIKELFQENVKNVGPAAKQIGVGAIAGFAGVSANQLLALSTGQIYNPNVELLYNGPRLRGFNFNFTFVPKSAAEARIVNNIIMEFKKWSAPEDTGDGMYKVPHVWRVQYMTGSGKNKNMNSFKKAALSNVAVQNNQGMNMHMSFPDGMPIITSLSLSFTEVDVITRNDHLDGNSFVGY